jgi:hypothetical protein
MLKRLLILIACSSFAIGALAEGGKYADRDTAVIRIMNKAAGKAKSITAPIGQKVEFEKLRIEAKSCKQTAPYAGENFYMFVQIEKSGQRVFSGWMDRNEPGENPLQDPDYDLWLVGCE